MLQKIKSGRKTANINTKNLISLITDKITWFILVLHWAMDVIYDFYYIHGPMEY